MVTALINGIILDGTKDMMPLKDKVILIEDKEIKDIVDQSECFLNDCKVIDLKGQYLLPGLINLHVHTAGTGKPVKRQLNLPLICKLITLNQLTKKIGYRIVEKNMYTTLMSGTTTIRAVGGIGDLDSYVRNEINAGKKTGPRMLVADSAIATVGGHMAGSFSTAVGSEKEAVSLVEKIATNKPDLIKIMITGGVLDADEIGKPGKMLMSESYIKTVCDKAHALGYKVAAHTEGTKGVEAALENGVDTIEHGAPLTDKIKKLFKEKNAVQVLTISPAVPFVEQLPGVLGMSETAVINSRALLEGMVEMAKDNLSNDVTVGLGTDASCSYCLQSGMWRELVYFVKYCHVSNQYAIHTATKINADIAGIGNITGTLEKGKMADIIVVKDNPLDDLTTLKDVTMAIKEGTVYDHPDPVKYPEVENVLDSIL